MTIAADSDFSSRPRPMPHYVDTELSPLQVPAAPARQPMLKRWGSTAGGGTRPPPQLRPRGQGRLRLGTGPRLRRATSYADTGM